MHPACQGEERGDFEGQKRYGAISVIKRLRAKTYPQVKLGWKDFRSGLESFQDIAAAFDSEEETDKNNAVLLGMDGDDMSQWVSGTNVLRRTSALAEKARAFFLQNWKGDLSSDKVKRLFSPSYHAALSGALNHFSLHATGQVVEKFHGRLFYADGDDVFDILPAGAAIDCPIALKCALPGKVPPDSPPTIKDPLKALFHNPQEGLLACKAFTSKSDHHRPNRPLLVPGPTATVSVGIAIGHVRSPMQAVIQAARNAETAVKKPPKTTRTAPPCKKLPSAFVSSNAAERVPNLPPASPPASFSSGKS